MLLLSYFANWEVKALGKGTFLRFLLVNNSTRIKTQAGWLSFMLYRVSGMTTDGFCTTSWSLSETNLHCLFWLILESNSLPENHIYFYPKDVLSFFRLLKFIIITPGSESVVCLIPLTFSSQSHPTENKTPPLN